MSECPRIELCDSCGDSWIKDYLSTRGRDAWVFVDKNDPNHTCGNFYPTGIENQVAVEDDRGEVFTLDTSIVSGVETERKISPPPNGPCAPWIDCNQLRTCCSVDAADEELELAIRVASEWLWACSGRRYGGICERTIRPACKNCCTGVCLCSGPCDLDDRTICLPGPVAGIKHIFINGEEVPPSDYFCTEYRNVIRCSEPWPTCNDLCADPYKLPTIKIGAPKIGATPVAWVNELLEGNKWFEQYTPSKIECEYCYGEEYGEIIPEWAKDFWSRIVCDEEKGKLASTPCEECKPWVNEYLQENDIKIWKGRVTLAYDQNGCTTDAFGRTYITGGSSNVFRPEQFKSCCRATPNFCCAKPGSEPSSNEANMCCRELPGDECSCSYTLVSSPSENPDGCDQQCPIQYWERPIPHWAKEWLQKEGETVEPGIAGSWFSQQVTHSQGAEDYLVPLWLKQFLDSTDEEIVYGTPLLTGEENLDGWLYICDADPTVPEPSQVVIKPCSNYANFCCAGSTLPTCEPECTCDWFIVEEKIELKCEEVFWGDSKHEVPEATPHKTWPDWVRGIFGLDPIETVPVEASDKYPDWVNENLNRVHEATYGCQGREIVLEGPVSPWVAEFLEEHDIDHWGNTIVVPEQEPEIVYTSELVIKPDSPEYLAAKESSNWKPEHTAWEIVYYAGREVPYGGQMAAADLACEIAKARCGAPCAFPQNTTFVNMNGVSVSLSPLNKLLERGSTGIWTVDMWLKSVNPYGLARASMGLDPQQYKKRHTNITSGNC